MQHITTWGARAATTRFQGYVTAQDFLQCAFGLTSDTRFDAMSFFVADFLDITGHAIDAEWVREDLAAQAIGGRVTNMRYQIVVVTDDAGIDAFTQKMRAIYGGNGPEIFTFRTRAEAALWMDAQKPSPNFGQSRF